MEEFTTSEVQNSEIPGESFTVAEEAITLPSTIEKGKKNKERSELQKEQFKKAREKRFEQLKNKKNDVLPVTSIAESSKKEELSILNNLIDQKQENEEDESTNVIKLINDKIQKKKMKWVKKILNSYSSDDEEELVIKKPKLMRQTNDSIPTTSNSNVNSYSNSAYKPIPPLKPKIVKKPDFYFV
jgi:hypothetical protein